MTESRNEMNKDERNSRLLRVAKILFIVIFTIILFMLVTSMEHHHFFNGGQMNRHDATEP
jgi:hypothetical protein